MAVPMAFSAHRTVPWSYKGSVIFVELNKCMKGWQRNLIAGAQTERRTSTGRPLAARASKTGMTRGSGNGHSQSRPSRNLASSIRSKAPEFS